MSEQDETPNTRPRERIIHEEKISDSGMSDYIFSFELSQPYPSLRSYLIKKPLKKSMKDTFLELFDNQMK
jgi:hypothetical protein